MREKLVLITNRKSYYELSIGTKTVTLWKDSSFPHFIDGEKLSTPAQCTLISVAYAKNSGDSSFPSSWQYSITMTVV